MLNLDIPRLCKQCRSRSVGFWRSQLIWICTVCHLLCEFIRTIQIKQSDWLKIRNGCGILIYSAWQGLKLSRWWKGDHERLCAIKCRKVVLDCFQQDLLIMIWCFTTLSTLTLVLLTRIYPAFINSVDPEQLSQLIWIGTVCLFVLRFYGPVNPMGSCRARSVYLTTRLLGRLSPLSG